MALSTGTLTFDLADHIGNDFDARRTKVWLTTNVPGDTLVDKAANKIRLGGGSVTLNSDGTGSVSVWLPGPDGNPTSWQTYVHVDYADTGTRERKRKTFGPFTITGSVDLADLIEEQEVPPTYLEQVRGALAGELEAAQEAREAAEIARDEAVDISSISTSDDVVEALVKGTAGAGPKTRSALSASYVAEGSAFADLGKQAGVDSTGAVECAAAIQAALNGFASLGVRAYARGTFKIASTVTIKANADLGDATFKYSGSGVAVQVGDGAPGVLLRRKRIALPVVVNTGKSAPGWAVGSVGVRAVNTQECDITVSRIYGFETGYYAYALGGGNVYNDLRLAHLDNNKRNLVLGAGAGGWSNQNVYRLGSLSHESSEGAVVSGTRQIVIETAGHLVNGNEFIGGSVEGNTAEYHLDCDGLYNTFEGVRWENSGGCRVIWRTNATRNLVNYGYSAANIIETHVAGSGLNRALSMGMSRLVGSSDKAVSWLENTAGATKAVDAVMDPGATLAGSDPVTAYRVYRTANSTRMKRATDAHDRLVLDHDNGRVYFGDAAAAIAMYLAPVSTSGISINGGNLYFNTDNTYDIGLDTTSLRPRDAFLGRDLRAGRVVKSGAGVTGSRPAPSAAGAGGMWFDTTLGKPIWSTGTAWVDAAGVAV